MNFSKLVSKNGLFCDGDWIEKKDQDENGDVRLIQLADIGVCDFKDKSSKHITSQKAKELNCTYLKQGDILIARLPEPLGRACIFPLDGNYITAVDIAIIRINSPRNIYNPYVMYMINSPQFRNKIKQFESGTTRKRISRKNLDKIEFEIPSYEKQTRIVTKIEELFSQLDSGVETLKKTKQQLAVYRQAVLKEAFEMFTNEYIPLSSIIEKPKYGSSKKCDYNKNDSSVAVYRIPNIDYENGIIDYNDIKYAEFSEEELQNIDLKEGDILVIRSNGSVSLVGRTAVIRKIDITSTFAGYLIRVRFKNPSLILAKYIHYFMESHKARIYIENAARSTSGVHNINSVEISKLLVPFSDADRIKSTVEFIESRLSVCDSIEKTVDEALQQAEALRQSILKKAFEGEL